MIMTKRGPELKDAGSYNLPYLYQSERSLNNEDIVLNYFRWALHNGSMALGLA